jgi:hypothetical protein
MVWVLLLSLFVYELDSLRVSFFKLFVVCLWFLVGSSREVDLLKAESNTSVGGQLGSTLFVLMLLASAGNSWPAALLAVSSLRMIYILNALRRGDLAY